MFNNLKFNIFEKFVIKNSIDIVMLIAIFMIFAVLKIYNANSILTFTILAGTFVLFFIIHFMINIWFGNSLKSEFSEKTKKISKVSENINELLEKQKQAFNVYVETTKDYSVKLEEIKETSQKNSQISQQLSEQVSSSIDYANKEYETIRDNGENLTVLKQRVQIIADLILELSEYNQQVVSNIGIVENIAEQTNMLALNATVEAARAGEHGKGFAVVASEIRKLADEAKIATNKISSLTNNVQNITHSTIMATEESSKEIDVMSKSIDLAKTNINEINNTVKAISKNVLALTEDTQKIFSTEFNASILSLSEEIDDFLKTLDEAFKQLKSEEKQDL